MPCWYSFAILGLIPQLRLKVEPNSTVSVDGDKQIIFEYTPPRDVPTPMKAWQDLFAKINKEPFHHSTWNIMIIVILYVIVYEK